jgi:hypothetical protein
MTTTTQPAPNALCPVPAELANGENFSPEFLLILGMLGFEVLIVRFQALGDSPIWQHAGLELELEKELRADRLCVDFNSAFSYPAERYFFFHVNDLGKAMAQIASALEARGLLEIATLFHVETSNELRRWHPATAPMPSAVTAT